MRLHSERVQRASRFWSPQTMRDELSHALVEALYELDVLPEDEDGAVLGIYAVMDDIQAAIQKTQALDLARSA